MLTDGLQFINGSAGAENFKVQSGESLPATDNTIGKLFYRTSAPAGLYVYKLEGWAQVGGVATWGQISGALAAQSDLNATLNTLQIKSEKDQPNGYLGLNSSGNVPLAKLGSGTANNTTYLRGDGTWQIVESGGETTISGPDYRFDLGFSNPGMVDAGKVFMFVSPRTFKILASGHRGAALTAPADAVTFDVWKKTPAGASSKIGTINFAAGALNATSTMNETNFSAGDLLYFDLVTADPTLMDVAVTLMAHVV